MGWILTSKKKQARELAQEQAEKQAAHSAALDNPATRQNWDPETTLIRTRLAIIGVSAVGLLLAWGWMSSSLERYAADRLDREDTPVVDVEFAHTPMWMSEPLKAQLQAVVSDHVTNNPMAADELRSALLALSSNPWVDSVKQVRRTSSGSVEVEAHFREPVAAVEQGGVLRLVDAKAVILPGQYSLSDHDRLGLPVIRGVAGKQPNTDGVRWAATELEAGLLMIKTLRNQPYFNQVVAYDVGRRDAAGRIRLSLVTLDGRIDWGLPVGQEKSIEPDVAHKLQLVSSLFQPASQAPGAPMVSTISNRVANVYGDSVTFVPLAGSRDEGRIEYTRGR